MFRALTSAPLIEPVSLECQTGQVYSRSGPGRIVVHKQTQNAPNYAFRDPFLSLVVSCYCILQENMLVHDGAKVTAATVWFYCAGVYRYSVRTTVYWHTNADTKLVQTS